MRQKLTITFTTLLLMIFTLVQLNGQAWQVYDGSQLPVDAGLQSSDVGGVPIVHSIINDADIPFNRIYEYRLLGPDSK
ncbi:MAG: hypothetical protein JXB17_13330, partial [Bacteroidales bacterium]|nr:hypothetical protein [Bacteroidales bacterium]